MGDVKVSSPNDQSSPASRTLHLRVEHFQYRCGIKRLLENRDVIGMNHQFERDRHAAAPSGKVWFDQLADLVVNA